MCSEAPGRSEALPWEKEDLQGLCTRTQNVSPQVEKAQGRVKGGTLFVTGLCLCMPTASADHPSEAGPFALSLMCVLLCLFQEQELIY